jgi:NAD+ synthase
MEPAGISRKLEAFIRTQVKSAGAKGVVVGLSGGVDSAVVAALCVRALGKSRVLALLMNEDWQASLQAEKYAERLGIEYKSVGITPILRSFALAGGKPGSKLAGANLRPRTRMALLYYFANSLGLLVVGTGNKSELLTGYFTKYGDGGVDFLPIGDLYKTQVRELAVYLGVPDPIIRAPPTAGLWRGQTDEGELGVTYAVLDKLLHEMNDHCMTPAQAAKKTGAPLKTAKLVEKKMAAGRHKLVMAPVCLL